MTLSTTCQVWTTACPFDRLIPGRGVGVLLDDGSQAALFRLDDESLRALATSTRSPGLRSCLGASSVIERAGRWCSRRS